MPQIAIIDYSSCSIEIISLSDETYNKYVGNFDELVFGVWGYSEDEIYYMVGENGIAVNRR